MNIIDNFYKLFGKFSIIFIFWYALYYFLVSVHTLSVFESFVSNAINPPISMPLLSLVLIICACYGAYQGIEAITRTSLFIVVLIIISFSCLIFSLSFGVQNVNFKPLCYNGFDSFIYGFKYMVSQSFCLPAMALLFPYAKGNLKKGIIIWNVSIYLLFIAIIILIVGNMGDFVSTQLFPLYIASGIGKFGSMRHLDVMYLGVWMSGIFLKISVFICLCSLCVLKFFGKKIARCSIWFTGACLFFISLFPDFMDLFHTKVVTDILFFYIFILLVIFGLIVLYLKKREKGGIKN